MRNAIISIGLFIDIMCGVFYLNDSIITLCDDITSKSNEIGFALMNDDLETSYYLSNELINLLQAKNFEASIYLNHNDFDNLLNEVLKLSIYILNNDRSESMASLNILQYNTQHIRSLQIPKLENIF